MLRGLSGQSIQQFDRFVTDQVTVHLFADDPPRGVGTDLVALNVQRGRDHGIPGTTAAVIRPCIYCTYMYIYTVSQKGTPTLSTVTLERINGF